MKIESPFTKPEVGIQNTGQINRAGADRSKPVQPITPPGQEDRVELSQQAKEIVNAQKTAAAIPDVRQGLVDQIKSRIENGTYAVNAEKTASGLLGEALVNQMALN